MKKWQKITCLTAATVALMYGAVYMDVVMRARSAYLEGEKYWNWTDHPEQRAQFLDAELAAGKASLQSQLSQGKLTQDDFDRQMELLQFDHEQQAKESTIKYAYIWYQTAAELFSPPNSKWVQLARQKMPQAKDRWKAELRAKKIPFEDYMID